MDEYTIAIPATDMQRAVMSRSRTWSRSMPTARQTRALAATSGI